LFAAPQLFSRRRAALPSPVSHPIPDVLDASINNCTCHLLISLCASSHYAPVWAICYNCTATTDKWRVVNSCRHVAQIVTIFPLLFGLDEPSGCDHFIPPAVGALVPRRSLVTVGHFCHLKLLDKKTAAQISLIHSAKYKKKGNFFDGSTILAFSLD
jgi:hypothetical protein